MTHLMKPLLIAASLACLAFPSLASADPDRRDRDGRDRDGSGWEQQYDRRDAYERYAPPPRGYIAPRVYGEDGPRHDRGHRHWKRGQYLSPYVRTYVVYDYGRHRLRPPPRGFVWIRADDNYLLVAAATGMIFDVIRGGW
ncbi:MAG: hypothetical protein RLZZ141_752 [Pseudomonadota bacterium]